MEKYNYKHKGFSLAEMMLSLLIVSICLAAVMPVITQKKTTGGEGRWMSSNNSDIYYGIGSSRVSIGTSLTPTTNAKLTIAAHTGDTITTPLINFFDSTGSTEIGRISFDNAKFNTGLGDTVLSNNTTGYENTGLGRGTLALNTDGYDNTAVGFHSLNRNTTGYSNSAYGSKTLEYTTTGTANTAVGTGALYYNTTGSGNIAIGLNAGPTATSTTSNLLYIDNALNGANSFVYGNMDSTLSNRALVFNSNSIKITNATTPATYSMITAGGTTITTSDIRLKNVKGDFNEGLKQIVQIQPKKYSFKADKKNEIHTGIIAQDLQKIFPHSVYKQPNGYLSVSQDEMFYAMINSIKELNKENNELKNQLKEIKDHLNKIENGSTNSNKKLGLLRRIWIFLFGE